MRVSGKGDGGPCNSPNMLCYCLVSCQQRQQEQNARMAQGMCSKHEGVVVVVVLVDDDGDGG